MNNKFIITVERINGSQLQEKVKFEIPQDTGLFDWKYIFSAILAFVSFDAIQIVELFEGETNEETNCN
jgi:hypothetical protein